MKRILAAAFAVAYSAHGALADGSTLSSVMRKFNATDSIELDKDGDRNFNFTIGGFSGIVMISRSRNNTQVCYLHCRAAEKESAFGFVDERCDGTLEIVSERKAGQQDAKRRAPGPLDQVIYATCLRVTDKVLDVAVAIDPKSK